MLRNYAAAVRGFSTNARLYLGTSLLVGFSTGLLYLLFNLYVLSLGYDQAFVGLLASLPALVTAVAAVPAGIFLPRLGYRRALLTGLAVYGMAQLAWVLYPTRPILILASIVSGLGGVLISVVASPLMVAVSTEETRTHLFGVQFALNTFASVVASFLGGQLTKVLGVGAAGASAGYRGVLLMATAVALLAFIPILRLRGMAPVPHAERPPRGHWRPYRPLLERLVAIQLVASLGAGMTMPFLNVFFRLRFHASDATLGALFAASSLLTGCAGIIAPWAAGKLGKVRAIVLSQALSIPLLLAMGLVPVFGPSAGSFLVRTALMNMSSPVFSAYSMGIVPKSVRPLAASLLMLAWNGGWAISAWISGRVQLAAGFTPLFIITATLYSASIVMTYAFFRHVGESTEAEHAAVQSAEALRSVTQRREE
ncbi:MAG: MFS transporter [Candidatus Bipolaricaulota bacterium]|nr:MFS transporter [Candidatus Bipolaricaulota bacterium]